MHCKESDCLHKKSVCDYYGYDCDEFDVTISELNIYALIIIKIQWVVSFSCWAIMRVNMRDGNIFTIGYIAYWIGANIISYNFRKCGVVYFDYHNFVIYTPYYSKAFADSGLSYIVAFVVWAILACVLFVQSRAGPGENENGNENENEEHVLPNFNNSSQTSRMVLCCCGYFIDEEESKIDASSIICNILVFFVFIYASLGAAIWIGVDNIGEDATRLLASTKASDHSTSNLFSWIDFLTITITNYFLPIAYIYLPFNLVTITTIFVFILDLIAAFLKLCMQLDDCLAKKINKIRDVSKSKKRHKTVSNNLTEPLLNDEQQK